MYILNLKKMADQKVVEMLDENLASFVELVKKWLVEWEVNTKKLLNVFHQIRKEDLMGLINGTHEIEPKLSNIGKIIDEFVKIVRQKNFSLAYSSVDEIYDGIFRLFPNAAVSKNPIPKFDWTPADTKNGITFEIMEQAAQKMYLSQAIQCFTEELKNGSFDTIGTCRVIFLEEKHAKYGQVMIMCRRNFDDKFSLTLFLAHNQNSPVGLPMTKFARCVHGDRY
jgi:hypothetical protein